MAALVVVLTGMTALVHFFPEGLATSRHSLERTQATLLGKGKLEELRLEGFEAIADAQRFAGTPEPFWDSHQQVVFERFRWQAEVTQLAGDLVEVRLRVVWPWPRHTHHVSFATYVSRR
ncbi:MAG: hypothetical protein HYZ81_18550 [Nitrospinae bacterium]|nr:hypothetical protein [Nitrospinota bacterium]